MNVIAFYRDHLCSCLTSYRAQAGLSEEIPLSVEMPKNHGDFSTNAAMILSRGLKKPPRDVAEEILPLIKALPYIKDISIAGAGFINWNVTAELWHLTLDTIRHEKHSYGEPENPTSKIVNIEFISANPTGPLHIGHLRGAIFGDVLARLLKKTGHTVICEYYINDAGRQIDALARSLWYRYCEAYGQKPSEKPQDFYPGDYLIDAALTLKKRDGEKWLGREENFWLVPIRDFSVEAMMKNIRQDIDSLGIHFDYFSSEKELVESGQVASLIENLKARDLIYKGVLEKPKGLDDEKWEKREQWLFRSRDFGDDADRPLYKKDGSLTYFASDIAYHHAKYLRGADRLIDVLGADHTGYTDRIAAATHVICDQKIKLEAIFCQLVRLVDKNKIIKMSKRAGSFVTIRDLIDSVGADAIRFFMLMRKNDAPLDFDLGLVKEQSRNNPVFYVQYAHARCHSVFRMAENTFPDISPDLHAEPHIMNLPAMKALLRQMAFWPQLLAQASERAEPHRVSFYLFDLAAQFHSLWTQGRKEDGLRFVHAGNIRHTQTCLGIIEALTYIIASGLAILGIEPAKEMKG